MDMLKNKKIKSAFLILSLILPVAIFAFTAWNTHGWDDEFFSIKWLELDEPFLTLINRINHNDTQPIGMYVFDLFFYKIFNNWSAVRLSGAIIVAFSLWLYWFLTHKKESYANKFLSYILLCLNPSLLLWCTGLRWYTWLMPLICFLGILINKSKENFSENGKIKFWACYFFVSILMFHIVYYSAVLILASFLCICYERRKFLISELKIILSFGILSLILISYQAYFFFTVHYPNGSNVLNSSIFQCFLYAGQYFLSGAALIPVSFFGILSITAGIILFFVFIINSIKIIKSCSYKFFIL